MAGARILLVGVLALGAVLVLTAFLAAMAPYIAATTVIMVGYWFMTRNDPPDPPYKISEVHHIQTCREKRHDLSP
jgi:hypothetical protein